MSWVATSVAIVGAAVSAYGIYQSGQAQKEASEYNAKLAENEALAKEQQIRSETERMRKEKEKATAAQRASYAKSGAVITEGTPLLTMAEEAGLMELDILQMQRSGKMGVESSLSQASMSRFEGAAAARSATSQAAGTLLSGAGDAYTTYKTHKK